MLWNFRYRLNLFSSLNAVFTFNLRKELFSRLRSILIVEPFYEAIRKEILRICIGLPPPPKKTPKYFTAHSMFPQTGIPQDPLY